MKNIFEDLGLKELSSEIVSAEITLLINPVGKLSPLTDREKAVITRYYGICCPPEPLSFIGEGFGISGSRVSQIRNKALRKLRGSPKMKELVALAEERRWLRKDEDLQRLYNQVKKLTEELSTMSSKFASLSATVSEIARLPQITDAIWDVRTHKAGIHWSISDMELTVRTSNCLKAMHIYSVGQLISKSEQELLENQNMGRRSINEIKEILASKDLTLGMKLS